MRKSRDATAATFQKKPQHEGLGLGSYPLMMRCGFQLKIQSMSETPNLFLSFSRFFSCFRFFLPTQGHWTQSQNLYFYLPMKYFCEFLDS